MMSGNRNLLWLLPLLALVSSPLWWPAIAIFLQPRGDFSLAADRPPPPAGFVLERLLFVQHSQGQEDIRLRAVRASAPSLEAPIAMLEIDAAINDRTDKTYLLTSRQGLYDADHQTLTLTESVKATTPDGYELTGRSLRYLFKQKRLESDQPVRLTNANLDLAAGTLVLDTETHAFSLGGRVRFSLSQASSAASRQLSPAALP